MTNKLQLSIISMVLLLLFATSWAQENWSTEQKQILAAIARLSASTAPGGGAEAYAAVLAEDFSRWTLGSAKMNDKNSWIDGIKEWFDDGWRVSNRKTQNLEILVKGDFAFTRRIVTETYQGPNNESSTSKAALAETWIKDKNKWLLLRVDIRTMNE